MICSPAPLAIVAACVLAVLLLLGWSLAVFLYVGLLRAETEVATLRKTLRALNWPAA